MLKSRYRRITFFFARVIGRIILWDLILPRIGLRRRSQDTRSERMRKMAANFRVLAIEMGGVMIKLGQFLSTRADVLPQEITAELAGLQDEVPAETFEALRPIIEREYAARIPEKFHQFAKQPLAAASLGQAHRAVLHEADAHKVGFQNVVVKVQRPDIDLIIETDLAALKRVAGWIQKYRPIAKRADVPALFREFARTLSLDSFSRYNPGVENFIEINNTAPYFFEQRGTFSKEHHCDYWGDYYKVQKNP